jgi:spore maturation protein CgeB
MKRILHVLQAPMGGQNIVPSGAFKELKVALISDELTRKCLAFECRIRDVTPLNYMPILKFWKPDLLFVESAWRGAGDLWKYKIASYPVHHKRSNRALSKVVSYARDLGIPCVFWNKEDCVHFDRFSDSAALFDYVFTVDENCISRYRKLMGPEVSVHPLMFAVQPAIHSPSASGYVHRSACFVGSYSHHIHDRRREWQDMMFRASSELGLTVFDRNSSRRSGTYRYPDLPWLELRKCVPHEQTAQIYRDYMVSLNVNTLEDSGTMFSRRLIEILACGGLAVTNPAPSVERYFKEYCEVVGSGEECRELFGRLKNGLTASDRDRALAGADYILREHTWAHRLEEVLRVIS